MKQLILFMGPKEAGIMPKRTITKTPSYSVSPKDLYNSIYAVAPSASLFTIVASPSQNAEIEISHSVQPMPLEEQLRDQRQTSSRLTNVCL